MTLNEITILLTSFYALHQVEKITHGNLLFGYFDSEHRELYSNMGMRMQHTIFLMMRLKSFRPEVDKSWQSRRECQK